MTSADFRPVTRHVTAQGAVPIKRDCRAGQISPDKDVNFRYTTAAFTLSPEHRASLCCANLPGDWTLYAVFVLFVGS